jgi:DNA-binding beta-propeller fold protein YncE
MALSEDGRIFVLNRIGGLNAVGIRIQICTFDEDWLGEFSTGPGTGADQFEVPICMAFDSQDRLYVTDESLNEVKVFDNQGEFVQRWGTEITGVGSLNGPAGIAPGSDGTVYVVEQYANRVHKLTSDGESILSWGEEGTGEGQFDLPWGATVDSDGQVYVADWRNDRIQKFTPEGEFLAAYGESGNGEGQFHRPSSVAVDGMGAIHVADWGNERVQVLDPDGDFHQMLYGEATLSKWAEEWLEVNPDEYDLRKQSDLLVKDLPAHLRTPYHTASQTEPMFWGPVSVKVDSEDRLYVTEHSRHRIQVYEQS